MTKSTMLLDFSILRLQSRASEILKECLMTNLEDIPISFHQNMQSCSLQKQREWGKKSTDSIWSQNPAPLGVRESLLECRMRLATPYTWFLFSS